MSFFVLASSIKVLTLLFHLTSFMAKIIKRVDVLVTEFMHEQQEVATLRKALDRTVRISRLSLPFCYS